MRSTHLPGVGRGDGAAGVEHVVAVDDLVAGGAKRGDRAVGAAVGDELAGRHGQDIGAAEPLLALLVDRVLAAAEDRRQFEAVVAQAVDEGGAALGLQRRPGLARCG